MADVAVNLYPFGPVSDGLFLETRPEKYLEEKSFGDKPVLIGTNANEGYWSLMYLLGDLFKREELSEDERTLSTREYRDTVSQIFDPNYSEKVWRSFLFSPKLPELNFDSPRARN